MLDEYLFTISIVISCIHLEQDIHEKESISNSVDDIVYCTIFERFIDSIIWESHWDGYWVEKGK